MEHHEPGPDQGPAPSGARVEDDLVRPLKRVPGISRRRLPAALPFAVVAILVVTSMAFGATAIRNVILMANATPVVVGDDGPTDSPTVAPTDVPTQVPTVAPTVAPTLDPTAAPTAAPTAGELSLGVEALAGKAKLTWSAYTGADFAYYKVVRSTDGTPSWPLGSGDTLVAAIDNPTTTTYTDSCGAGTFTYRVFAVKATDAGYVVLAASDDKTVTIAPAPTKTPPPPVSNPSDLGALSVKDNGDGTYTFSWHAYTGSIDFSYYKLDGQAYPKTPGYVENGGDYWACLDTNTTSTTISVEPGTWNIVVEAVYYPAGGSAAAAKTQVLKLTVAPKTAPPVASMTLSAVVQSDGVHLTWSKYTGPYFQYYGIVRTEGSTPPTLVLGTVPNFYFSNVDTLSYVDKTAKPGHTYHYQAYAFTESTLSSAVMPACTANTILAVSNVVDVTIPAAATPTPATPAPASPTPAPPTDAPSASVSPTA